MAWAARDPFAQCCAPQKPDRQLGRDKDVPYGVRISFHEWHNNMLENVIGVYTIPHTSLSSTGVVKGVKSVDDLTSADL